MVCNMKPVLLLLGLSALVCSQQRRVGGLLEVYSWKQLTYNINGNILTADRATPDGLERERFKRQNERASYDDAVVFNDQLEEERIWNTRPSNNSEESNPSRSGYNNNFEESKPTRPGVQSNFEGSRPSRPGVQSNFEESRPAKLDERSHNFFIQYNNVPMGAERVGNRLFVTIPRRRHGIPSTLNYIDLRDTARSPHLRPYPSLRASRNLTSIYRTRADNCGRLWAVDTGLLELPENPEQVQRPAIVVFDLKTDRQILRYELKDSDIPANNTPTGLASITVDTSGGCAAAHAYVPDLTTNGLIVFSLRARDSWRLSHNYFHFNPAAASLDIAGQQFQWSDGIFSIALAPGSGCRAAYFHPMISTQEFAVNTCTLNNRTAAEDPQYWTRYSIVAERGPRSQSTSHDMHASGAALFAAIGADGVACWRPGGAFRLLASDARALSYPADLHITGDEVWVIANTLPRFGYSRLNPDDYNFFIYKANVLELIAGTECAGAAVQPASSPSDVISFGARSSLPPAPSATGFQSSAFNKYNL